MVDSMKEVRIALVGIGGYGESYIKALLDSKNSNFTQSVRIVGAIDPNFYIQ